MMTREEILKSYPDLAEGVHVVTRDGEKLGTVLSLNNDSFSIGRGVFFPKDFTARYADIAELDSAGGQLVIDHTLGTLGRWKNPNYIGWIEVDRRNRDPELGVDSTIALEAQHDELLMPIAEQELSIEEIQRLAEEMQIRKVAHTEIGAVPAAGAQ